MPSMRRVARAGLPIPHGSDSKEHVALATGFEAGSLKKDVPVRFHSECLTAEETS